MGADISLSDLFLAGALGPTRTAAGEGGGESEKPTTLSRRELEEWAELFRRGKPPAAEGETEH